MTDWSDLSDDEKAVTIALLQGNATRLPLADGVVDHIITDPPYTTKVHKGARVGNFRTHMEAGRVGARNIDISFDALDLRDFRSVVESVAPRRWVVATMAYQHAFELEQEPPAGYRFVRLGVWVKPNAAPQFTGDRPAMGWEAIAILHRADTKMRWNGGGRHGVWTCHVDRSRFGGPWVPTAKPLGLLADLIEAFTDPGDLILDPYCGSGTTGIAARELGRRAVLCDQDRDTLNIAALRAGQPVSASRREPAPPSVETPQGRML